MTLCEEVCGLVGIGYEGKLYSAIFDMVTNEIIVDLNMLDSFMKNIFECNFDGTITIRVEGSNYRSLYPKS